MLAMLGAGATAATNWDDDDSDRSRKRRPPCVETADLMLNACTLDIWDDFTVARANCTNLNDRQDRKRCLSEARKAQRQDGRLCRKQRAARIDVCELLGEQRYDPDPLLDPNNTFVHPDDVTTPNPYVAVEPGHTYVLRGIEDGEQTETVVVHVTDEVRVIQDVACRVVVDIVVEAEGDGLDTEYEPIEVTFDWFALDDQSNVYYCGEIASNFEDGLLENLDGSFEAGRNAAKSGELVRFMPNPGDAHRQEFALGEAEDVIQYVSTSGVPSDEAGGDNPEFPCAPAGCLQTHDLSALAPDGSEFKYYLPGVGFVLAVALDEDGEPTGEREELACVGDSLDVLDEPRCGIANVGALRETLCKLSPDAFCED
jgi:hypothetical protein